MAYTQEPKGLTWINNCNPNALSIIVSQICWLAGSLAFTALVWWLMTLLDYYSPVGVPDANGARQMVLISRETMRQGGAALAFALLGAWTGKSIVGAVDAQNKRKLHPDAAPALEAQERGKVAGAAAAVVLAEQAADMKSARAATLTSEHPVPPAPPATAPATAVTVNTGDQSTVNENVPPAPPGNGGEPPHEWASGDPNAGVL